ncbi:MAG: Putative major capsid protein [Edwardsiella phage MSW-3]|nr:MAG: Putative major capsid protein [Edwardsiella phage MSW-3]
MAIKTIDAQTIQGNQWLVHKGYVSRNGDQWVINNTALDAIGNPNVMLDADGGIAFYISQLAGIEATVYETPYGDITYRSDVPMAANIPEYADTWMYRSYDGVTMGKFIGANGQDLPRVAQSAQMHNVPLGYAGNECHYTLDEMRKSAAMNMPIDAEQARLAFRGAEEHSQSVAYFGDSSRGMYGLFNNPNVTLSSATKDYKTMNGQELFNMLNAPIFSVINLSRRFHVPNTALMFPDLWNQANNQLMTGYTDRTVMQHFMEANSYTLLTGNELDIQIRFQLDAAELAANGVSNSNKPRYMVYDKSDRNLAMANPIPFRMLAPQMASLGITVPAEYKISGTEFRYPLCAAYVDMA